jgi:hypothetical protein
MKKNTGILPLLLLVILGCLNIGCTPTDSPKYNPNLQDEKETPTTNDPQKSDSENNSNQDCEKDSLPTSDSRTFKLKSPVRYLPVAWAADADLSASKQDIAVSENTYSVYFRIVSYRAALNQKSPTFTVSESTVSESKDSEVLRNIPLKDDEFLWTYNDRSVYLIQILQSKKTSAPIAIGQISSQDLIAKIQQKLRNHPDKKWRIVLAADKNRVELEFNGIKKVYELRSVTIPRNSQHFKHSQYHNGHAPKFRVYIDKNGENVGCIQSNDAAWTIDFASSDTNRWEIREGIGDRYLIRLRDWNTWTREHPILDRNEVSSKDFAKGDILESLGPDEDRTSAVKFKFALAPNIDN